MNKSEQKKYRWAELKKLSDGLLPVVVQDNESNQVLMVAYMNEENQYAQRKGFYL